MTRFTNKNRVESFTSRAGAVMLVAAAAIVGVLVTSAFASGGRTGQRPAKGGDIAALSLHPKVARIASAGTLNPPPGATLAAVSDDTDLYVLHDASGEDCVIHLTAGSGGGSVCEPSSAVENEGEVGVGATATASGSIAELRVTALVPNGVSVVRFTDRDGSSFDIPVTHNVLEHKDLNVASVSYVLPDGQVHTTNVAAIADQVPSQPGSPGSASTSSQ
jgi:hypothetical protein